MAPILSLRQDLADFLDLYFLGFPPVCLRQTQARQARIKAKNSELPSVNTYCFVIYNFGNRLTNFFDI
jgi:hypothetical protein